MKKCGVRRFRSSVLVALCSLFLAWGAGYARADEVPPEGSGLENDFSLPAAAPPAAPLACPAAGPPALNNLLPIPGPGAGTCTVAGQAACNGWTPVGPIAQGGQNPAQIAGGPNGVGATAQLFNWTGMDAANNPIQCVYLARRSPGSNLEGLFCFNTNTCEVCTYNKFNAAPNNQFTDLDQPGAATFPAMPNTENCSTCHLAGPILPVNPFYNAARNNPVNLKRLQNTCSNLGGPAWIGPGFTAQENPVTANFCSGAAVPANCIGCHAAGFRKVPNPPVPPPFCSSVVTPAFGPAGNGPPAAGGSMNGQFNNAADCKQFMCCVGCDPNAQCNAIFPGSNVGACGGACGAGGEGGAGGCGGAGGSSTTSSTGGSGGGGGGVAPVPVNSDTGMAAMAAAILTAGALLLSRKRSMFG